MTWLEQLTGRGIRFRFGLRSLILTILTVGICLGWQTAHVRKRERAVTAVENAGGKIENAAKPNVLALRWLRGRPLDIRVISLANWRADDDLVAELRALTELQELKLDYNDITD